MTRVVDWLHETGDGGEFDSSSPASARLPCFLIVGNQRLSFVFIGDRHIKDDARAVWTFTLLIIIYPIQKLLQIGMARRKSNIARRSNNFMRQSMLQPENHYFRRRLNTNACRVSPNTLYWKMSGILTVSSSTRKSSPRTCLGELSFTIMYNGGETGIRTLGSTKLQRFSRPSHSTTLASLRWSNSIKIQVVYMLYFSRVSVFFKLADGVFTG